MVTIRQLNVDSIPKRLSVQLRLLFHWIVDIRYNFILYALLLSHSTWHMFCFQIVVPCFQNKKGKIDCVELCEERLSCGHSCPLKCHYSKDRHHEKFRCKKLCAKKCPEGHPCVTNHECSSQCKKCVTIVERKVPKCGHIGKMYCFESLTNYRCREQCGKVLDCGHSCRKKCCEPCDPCKVH